MLALWILLGILILIVLLGVLPVRVTAEYQENGPSAKASVGPFSFDLYPGKEEESAELPAEKTEKNKSESVRPKGGGLEPFRELLQLILQAQADVRNKVKVREFVLHLTIGGKGDDPAAAGIWMGRAWAMLGGMIPLLESSFQIKSRDIQADVDFLSEETRIYGKAVASISLGAAVRLGLYYGVKVLKWYYQKKKGGKKHGTSNQ